ncbi:uncharacterized protein LOC133502386 isoform X2 [Syngnathoides biaculeatus]|uniref:uncharacterized protein LOC133502386 isoform X2 n=1 Tax=Syngnathoides biaculeatus TaxID=300417 RepID=UPI002ADE2502|nr:uncharacterized protein LOC133502386 isoform X2 [Syngnathoides biaculeatus]
MASLIKTQGLAMESTGNFFLCGKAAVIEANLRDEYYWKLVADFVGPQTGEGLDLDREHCKNRLLIQSGLMREDNNFPWISVISWLRRIFPAYHSADFRRLIERGVATTLSLAGDARRAFLESYVNFNFVGPICDSIGVEREHLLKMKDFSERAQAIEVTNGLILELSNFVTRERVSPINLVTWLRNFDPEYCKDGKIQKAYRVLKGKIRKLKMCYHNSETRSRRRNIVMENLLQSPFDLVRSRDCAKTSTRKRAVVPQASPHEKVLVKQEYDVDESSAAKEYEEDSSSGLVGTQVSPSGGGKNAYDGPDVVAAKKDAEVLPSLLDVAMLSVQKLSSIHGGQTQTCKKISFDLFKNQYALTCKEHPTMELFEETLQSVDERVSLAPPAVFLQSNANFLVGVHHAVEQQVMAFEDEIIQSRGEKLGRDGNALFKKVVNFTESATSRFVHMAVDMLTPNRGALLNYKKHWVAFCKEKKNPSRLVRNPPKLFRSYLEAAAGLIHHHNEIGLFFSDMLALNNDEGPNVLLESLVADASDSVIQSIVCVLGIIYCKVVGPYWQLLKSAGEYCLFSQYLLCLYQKFLEWSKDPGTMMVPEELTNVFLQFPLHDKTYSGAYEYCGDLHTNRDLIRVCLKRMIKAITGVVEEHLSDFLPGGRFAKVLPPSLNLKLLKCKFAVLMADYPYGRPPGQDDNRQPTCSDSSDDLSSSDDMSLSDSQETSRGRAANSPAGAHSVKGRAQQKTGRRQALKIYTERTDLDYITSTVEKNGGPCRTQQDVDKLLLRLADTNRVTKREAIRCEIAYQKMVLRNGDPILNSDFHTTTDMMIKLKLALPRLKPGYSIILAPRKTGIGNPVRQSAPDAASGDPDPKGNQLG